ncbi:hypothetical protein AGMMS49545_15580 [Betaproteobacteria bacterium]|nr:hypothetical protein AGMMS49545_15580 [Betaproteobacteria bacterium]GHU41974.1 hypothetical protein AGMMS50289_05980 [Betaproteobacteria bacterium]
MSENLPNCRECQHYYITHDVRFPYGCRVMNFKSRHLPAQDVLAASGAHCLRFWKKPVARRAAG